MMTFGSLAGCDCRCCPYYCRCYSHPTLLCAADHST